MESRKSCYLKECIFNPCKCTKWKCLKDEDKKIWSWKFETTIFIGFIFIWNPYINSPSPKESNKGKKDYSYNKKGRWKKWED